MKILITGGMGFIGSHLAHKHLGLCDKIFIIDNLSTNTMSKDSDFILNNKNVVFFKMNLSDLNAADLSKLEEVLAEVSLVFHFAGPVGVKHIDQNPQAAIQSLFFATSTLFPLFEKYKNKVIYASTSEVYGESNDAKETDALSIGPPSRLRWGYACGKLMSEFMLRSYNFPYVILRFFNVTGAGQSPDFGMVVPNFITKALQNEDLIVFNQGNQIRTFCDVRDAVEMICILSNHKAFEREIFNIGNSKNLTDIDSLAKLVIKITKSSSQLSYKNFNQVYSENSGEIDKRVSNTKKIESIYTCQYTLEDIIDSFLLDKGTYP